jgi:hypothetical protein
MQMSQKIIKELLNNNLNIIGTQLMMNSCKSENLGLLNGKTGIAIFFYHYFQYSKDIKHVLFAEKLIDEVYNEIINCNNLNYENGIAGIATGIEYLVRNKFIDADTDKILYDVDNIIINNIENGSYEINLNVGLCGFGMYFINRLKNRNINNISKNRIYNIIENIICLLDVPYNSYYDLYSIISFLCEVLDLDINNNKAINYLNYAIDKVETMVYEDIHFNLYPASFNPLSFSFIILLMSRKNYINNYKEKAQLLLKKYEYYFNNYLNKDINISFLNSIRWSLLCKIVGKEINNKSHLNHNNYWLKKTIFEDKTIKSEKMLIDFNNNTNNVGLSKGYAGAGLSILTILEQVQYDWLSIIPLLNE